MGTLLADPIYLKFLLIKLFLLTVDQIAARWLKFVFTKIALKIKYKMYS